jgi:hypothetical protein
MKYINLFEKFSKEDYLKLKKDKEDNLIQTLGNEFIEDIIKDGDFDGLNFLLSTGYDYKEYDDENLLVVALKNNQMKIFDFLLKNKYAPDFENGVNSISLQDIVGRKNYDKPNKITKEGIEMLKTITEYGYKFYDGRYNLIEIYLAELAGVGKYKFIDGVEPFIDWLLENYPENYRLTKKFLSDELKNKYSYLENSIKYNL